jgi:hypothetical protein
MFTRYRNRATHHFAGDGPELLPTGGGDVRESWSSGWFRMQRGPSRVWRQILDLASHVRPALILIVLLYGVVTASYLVNSFPQVPVTHLWGLLIFHGMFLLFGFASARAPAAVFAILLIQGIAYVAIFGQYAIRFGDFVQNGFLEDVFGIGHDMAIATHQQVGSQMALAALAAFALASAGCGCFRLASWPSVPCSSIVCRPEPRWSRLGAPSPFWPLEHSKPAAKVSRR